ncbi:MaoC family dehydratase [Dysgonomonas sp. OttesenSCG-928-M03]|nr:MaoC family dehydratase [Dysgonomonas sp. OttesenSCG-928-M03]
MSKVTVNSHKEFEEYVGKEIGVSEYLKITQERINLFADATLDHQWIHTDPERAKVESPFHNTIAHGYLTLSLLPYMWNQIIEVNNIKMLINYGIDKLKFNQPVIVDHEVRLKVKLESLLNLRGISKAEIRFVLEIKDSPKNAVEGTVIFLYHFNNN